MARRRRVRPRRLRHQPRSKVARQANAHTRGEGGRWAAELHRRG